MKTRATQSLKRRWRAAGVALTGAAALLLAGTLGVGPALAGTQNCQLKVVIVGQPTTTQVGSPVAPPVVVNVENSNGKVDWNYNGWVTLSYAVNPDGAAGPAGNVAQAVHGVATFSQLTFGSGTLRRISARREEKSVTSCWHLPQVRRCQSTRKRAMRPKSLPA